MGKKRVEIIESIEQNNSENLLKELKKRKQIECLSSLQKSRGLRIEQGHQQGSEKRRSLTEGSKGVASGRPRS